MNVRVCALLWCFLRCVNNCSVLFHVAELPLWVCGKTRIIAWERLYEYAEKALWVCGKAHVGVRKRLYEDMIRAFRQFGNCFFARRERTDAVPVLSIC